MIGTMEARTRPCQHEWHYLVEARTRAIRIRVCVHCGRRTVVPVSLDPLPPARDRLRDSA